MRYRRIRIEGATYFFTVVAAGRRPIFANDTNVALLNSSIAEIRSRHPFEIAAQVVLPDHLHAIWSLPDGDADYSTRWRLIKQTFARKLARQSPAIGADQAGAEGRAVWQNRFWEHLIRDERDFAAHLDYIHLNPVHHGLVTAPHDWPHSTFGIWVERGVYETAWGSDVMPELPEWAKRHE